MAHDDIMETPAFRLKVEKLIHTVIDERLRRTKWLVTLSGGIIFSLATFIFVSLNSTVMELSKAVTSLDKTVAVMNSSFLSFEKRLHRIEQRR